jgi:uncharacterized protein (TIGR00369 family)
MDLELLDADGGAFVRHLGLEFSEMTGERVVANWKAAEKHHHSNGILHGGVHASVVETLGSLGAAVWFADRGHVVGVSNTTDFFRAVREGELVSVATPVHQGRSQQVWDVVTRDAEDRLVARGQLRVQNITR